MDGPQAVHDSSRGRVNGSSSFQRIWDSLLAIRASTLPVQVVLRIHLTPATLPCLPEFLAQVRDTFLDDDRFSVNLRPVERRGGPNDESIEVLPWAERAKAVKALESALRSDPTAHEEPGHMDVCCAARPNSFVSEPTAALRSARWRSTIRRTPWDNCCRTA
ncbi:hypothetical protein ABZ471_36315 [Streptomyces sp. NPDC005728]|uniref:hypothetical protein n=1 Tax=Streptomyces sp. NPDC005728 TaxID=3157054 RepID=UPI00340A9183